MESLNEKSTRFIVTNLLFFLPIFGEESAFRTGVARPTNERN
jgi:hypothetical protein